MAHPTAVEALAAAQHLDALAHRRARQARRDGNLTDARRHDLIAAEVTGPAVERWAAAVATLTPEQVPA